jgi:hypothetical protein
VLSLSHTACCLLPSHRPHTDKKHGKEPKSAKTTAISGGGVGGGKSSIKSTKTSSFLSNEPTPVVTASDVPSFWGSSTTEMKSSKAVTGATIKSTKATKKSSPTLPHREYRIKIKLGLVVSLLATSARLISNPIFASYVAHVL